MAVNAYVWHLKDVSALIVQNRSSTVSIFLLSVVFTKADEITNEIYSQKVAVPGSQTGYDQCSRLTNNMTIKIVGSNVVLDSKITVENLDNIAIIGHGTSTVNCIGIGAINFISCNNVTITGIDWERDHGAAVQYTADGTTHTQIKLVINSCNFSYNGVAKSVIFIDGSGNRQLQYSYLQNSLFVGNEGVPVYLSHHKLHIRGDVLFKQNTVIAGGGIFSSRSIVEFKDSSNVIFYNNSANTSGGAIFLNNSRIYFGEISVVNFVNNIATSYGGAVFSISKSATLFDRNTVVIFQSNATSTSGGALYFENSNMLFAVNSTVTFNHNTATFGGGAVFSTRYSEILFDGNATVSFIDNDASEGGAVEFYNHCRITFKGNSNVTFSHNSATYGGAVYSRSYSEILFDGNTTVEYKGNHANKNGGALNCFENCSITFDGNSKVSFSDNKARFGGAMCSRSQYYLMETHQ
ncbi:probable outer membrane protein pmp6 [Dysidea avara]|uniref:probable outer membrane protein pmp6 n=1 Tax=Dysidea avara TaxID=196820 RepID=UPI00332427E9